jgi:hypothetical protein
MIIRNAALFVVGLVLVLSTVFPSSVPPSGQSRLLDVYKAGPIRLDPDPAFGKSTEWNLLFFNPFCDLAAAPDGGFFIAGSREQKVFKFDARGSLVKSFGQKGQGPGDFNMPGELSVLDGKYLVVGEYALSCRISLFDLDGKFNRVLTTKSPPFFPIALRDGKVAYIVHRYRREDTDATKDIQSVVIRAIDNPREIAVVEQNFNMASIRLGANGSIGFGDQSAGAMYIAATREGNLLVGDSLEGRLEVYSPEGVKLSTIDLGLEPIPVTREYRSRYRDHQLAETRREHGSDKSFEEQLKQIENASFDHLFSDHLPFYHEILADAEGNILVFKRTDCLGGCPIVIRVYSPEGRFVCETELQEGAFGLTVDRRIKNMAFGLDGLVAMVEVKDAEEYELRVIRVNYKPAPH